MADTSLAAPGRPRMVREYLAAPLGAVFSDGHNRLLFYLVLAGLFFLEGLLAWIVYRGPVFLLDRMAFTTVFSLHKALIYALCLWGVDALARCLPRQWGAWRRRTVGKQWLIWGGGFLLGFALHRTLGLCLVYFYAPEVMGFFLAFPQARPDTVTILLYALPSWFAAVFLTLQLARGRQLKPQVIAEAPAQELSPRATQPAAAPPAQGRLELGLGATPARLPFSRITHVSVEDHYCRVFFTRGEDLGNVLVRLALKDLLPRLPVASFLQIHRSHLVNLNHAWGIGQKGRTRYLRLGQFGLELPISRHRLSQVQPRLQTARSHAAWAPLGEELT
ncbi:MAG: LytTR family DNA-binding domain-containing protein [Thermodesulfobacteriota bacterium]